MEANQVTPGAVIAPKRDKERLFRVDQVYARHGKVWVRLRLWKDCFMSLELGDVLENYVLCFDGGCR